MKTLGVVLLVVGILMMIFTSINFKTTKNVVDAGPLKIDKKENHRVGWPVYAGAVVSVLGVIVLVANRKA